VKYTEEQREEALAHLEANPRLSAWYWAEGLVYLAHAGRDHSYEGYAAHCNALLAADPTLYERLTTNPPLRPH
jgi:hypothetical protein